MGFSQYPNQIDGASTLPVTTDLVTQVRAEVVNRLRDAVIATQAELGVQPSGAFGTVKARLDSINALIETLRDDFEQGGIFGSVGTFLSPASVSELDVVYLKSSGTVDKADADAASKRPAIGVVISKPSSSSAVVQYIGEITGFSGLTPNASVYLSETLGQITETAPTADGSIVQEIGVVKNSTTIILMMTRNFIEL